MLQNSLKYSSAYFKFQSPNCTSGFAEGSYSCIIHVLNTRKDTFNFSNDKSQILQRCSTGQIQICLSRTLFLNSRIFVRGKTSGNVLFYVSQKKRAPMKNLPSYKFCSKKGYRYFIQINQRPQFLAIICHRNSFIWWDTFVLYGLKRDQFYNVFVIILCAVSQALYRKITKMVLPANLSLNSHLEN